MKTFKTVRCDACGARGISSRKDKRIPRCPRGEKCPSPYDRLVIKKWRRREHSQAWALAHA